MKSYSSLSLFLLVASCTLPPAEAQLVVTTEHTAVSPFASAAFTREVVTDQTTSRIPGVTRLQVGKDIANGIVAPEAPARVRVPTLEQVRLTAPADWPAAIQWTKNGEPIAGATEPQLILPAVTLADSGLYSITSNAPFPTLPTRIQLEVFPLGKFGNFSARIKLQPGNDTQVVGYAISGKETKRILIRAVGPTLRSFGVSHPVSEPQFRIYTSDGKELDIVRAAVVLPQRYWDEIFRQAGAFPLTGGEQVYEAYDALDLPPGTYTVLVRDGSKQGGEVLVELYEFDFYPPILG